MIFKLIFIYSVIFGLTYQTFIEDICGESSQLQNSRVRNHRGSTELWPWMVSAGYQSASNQGKWQHKCSGSAITNKHILSTAQCASKSKGWSLKFGDLNLISDTDDIDVFYRPIMKTILHPNYKKGISYFDVAIWEVQAFDLSQYVNSICIPSVPNYLTNELSGETAILAAYRKFSKNSVSLVHHSLRIHQDRSCNRTLNQIGGFLSSSIKNNLPKLIQPSLMCVGYEDQDVSCADYVGSPVFRSIGQGNQLKHELVGIVSKEIGKCDLNAKIPSIVIRIKDNEIINFIRKGILSEDSIRRRGPEQDIGGNEDPLQTFKQNPGLILPPEGDPNFKFENGGRFIHSLLKNGQFGSLINILKNSKTDINQKESSTGFTALHLSCIHKRHNFIQLLLKKREILVNIRDAKNRTPLYYCVKSDLFIGVEYLIDAGANVNSADSNSTTPLMIAARDGNLKIAQYLLQKGAKVNQKDYNGQSSMHYASRANKNEVKMIRLLMDNGGSIDSKDKDDNTLLHVACEAGNDKIVRLLLESGYFSGIREGNVYEIEPIMLAAKFDHSVIIDMLLVYDIRTINDEDYLGNTAIHYAAIYGNIDSVKMILKYSPDLSIRNNDDRTPLESAMFYGFTKIQTLILEKARELDLLIG